MNQAQAAGKAFSNVKIDRIYCSDLKRAHWTAQEVFKANKWSKKDAFDSEDEERPKKRTKRVENEDTAETFTLLPPTKTELLREQHFGKAEGTTFEAARLLTEGTNRRKSRFPEGESLDDVAIRANQIVERIIKPWSIVAENQDYHVLLVAHGIMISELSRAFLFLNPGTTEVYSLGPLTNTAYHQLSFTLGPAARPVSENLAMIARKVVNSDTFPDESPLSPQLDLPIRASVIKTSQMAHLSGIKKQKGGIGSLAFDSKQQDIKAFFGGGKRPSVAGGKL